MGVAFALGFMGISMILFIIMAVSFLIGLTILIIGIVIRKWLKKREKKSKIPVVFFVLSGLFCAPLVVALGIYVGAHIRDDIKYRDVLSYQVKNHKVQDVNRVLNQGVSPDSVGNELKFNYTSDNGFTVLHLLATDNDIEQNVEKVEALLDKGANINAVDTRRATPLMLACENNNYEVAKILLEKGADIDRLDEKGNSALMYLCNDIWRGENEESNARVEKEGIKMAKLLIKHNVKILTLNNWNNNALTIMNDRGFMKMVHTLESAEDMSNNLAYNIMYKKSSDVEKILKTGVSPNCKSYSFEDNIAAKEGEETLMYYMIREYEDIPDVYDKTKLLIKYGADLEHRVGEVPENPFGEHAGDIYWGNKLIEYGKTVLMLAAECADYNLVKILVDGGANSRALDEHGNTPLMYIATKNHLDKEPYDVDIAKLLLEKSKGISKNGNFTYEVANEAQKKQREDIREILISSPYYKDNASK